MFDCIAPSGRDQQRVPRGVASLSGNRSPVPVSRPSSSATGTVILAGQRRLTVGEGDNRYFRERRPIGISLGGRGMLVYVVATRVLGGSRS
jgi:hypothetical protein